MSRPTLRRQLKSEARELFSALGDKAVQIAPQLEALEIRAAPKA